MNQGRVVTLLIVFLLIMGLSIVPCQSKPRSLNVAEQDLSKAWLEFLETDSVSEPTVSFPYEDCFRGASNTYNLPLTLLLAVARGESDFDPKARSDANAYGLMQIQWPITARHLGVHRLAELYDPCTNVEAGARYLKQLLERYDGSLHLALAAYNYGPGRIPLKARNLPPGAKWYSAYIYRHLGYVLGQKASSESGPGPRRYLDEGKLELIVFSEPYRARAFVNSLQRAVPAVRLDWFKAGLGRFRVTLSFDGEADLLRSKKMLRGVGFSIN